MALQMGIEPTKFHGESVVALSILPTGAYAPTLGNAPSLPIKGAEINSLARSLARVSGIWLV